MKLRDMVSATLSTYQSPRQAAKATIEPSVEGGFGRTILHVRRVEPQCVYGNPITKEQITLHRM
jgi:hypothetical protein